MKLHRFIQILTVAVCSITLASPAAVSAATFDWEMQTGTTPMNLWYAVAYGNGVFVAVGDADFNDPNGSNIATSTDGVTWTQQTSPNLAMSFYDVVFNNGIFVAVVSQVWGGSQTGAATSPDGITWTGRVAARSDLWQSVTYGNGLFVAVSNFLSGSRVMTSPNGIDWTSRTPAANNTWKSVTHGNGLFVAVSGNGDDRVMTSPNGIDWTSRTAAASNAWTSVTYGNGLFVAVAGSGTGDRVMTSGQFAVPAAPGSPVATAPGTTKTLAVSKKQGLTPIRVANFAKLRIPKKSIVSVRVLASSRQVCAVKAGKLVALKSNRDCTVRVKTTKRGKGKALTSKKVTLQTR